MRALEINRFEVTYTFMYSEINTCRFVGQQYSLGQYKSESDLL